MKILFATSLLIALTIAPALADSSDNQSPRATRQEESKQLPHSAKWRNLSNVFASDDRYATVTLNESGFKEGRTSYLLCVSDFGFQHTRWSSHTGHRSAS